MAKKILPPKRPSKITITKKIPNQKTKTKTQNNWRKDKTEAEQKQNFIPRSRNGILMLWNLTLIEISSFVFNCRQ